MYGNNSILDLHPTKEEPESLEFFPSIINMAYQAAEKKESKHFSLRVVWCRSHNIFQPLYFKEIKNGTSYGFVFRKMLPIKSIFLQYGGIPIYMFGYRELNFPNKVPISGQISLFVNVDKSMLSTWKPRDVD